MIAFYWGIGGYVARRVLSFPILADLVEQWIPSGWSFTFSLLRLVWFWLGV